MSFVVAASVRHVRDVERLALVYLAGAVVYTGVVITRFDLGAGDAWRLGHLYYYDANDFATFAVTAMPLGIYFAHAGRRIARPAVRGGRPRRADARVRLVRFARRLHRARRPSPCSSSSVSRRFLSGGGSPRPRWSPSSCSRRRAISTGQQMGTITSDADYNHTSESGRLQIWSRGIGYMMSNPLLGVGPGTSRPPRARCRRWPSGSSMRHRRPLECAAQQLRPDRRRARFPGLALYIAVIVSAFVALRRAGDRSRRR